MNKKINWDTVDGKRSMRWGSPIGGLIAPTPVWQADISAEISFGRVFIYEDSCYVMAGSRTLHSLKLTDGEPIWSLELGGSEYYILKQFFSMEGFILAGSFVVDSKEGKLLNDLSQLTVDVELSRGEPMELKNGKIYSQVNSEQAPGLIMIYDPVLGTSEFVDIGMLNLVMPNDEITYGWKPIGDSHVLTSYDFRTSVSKTINHDAKLGILRGQEDYLLIMNESTISLVTIEDEIILWERKTDSFVDTWDPNQVSSYDVCMCRDTLGIFNSKYFVQLDSYTGNTLWTYHFDSIASSETCIVGDLIYATYGSNTSKIMCAIDRYNGEILWSQESGLPLYSVKAKDNKVIYVSVYGEILCYAWDENNLYHSPAKPE